MFDVGFTEILLIGIVSLVVIGPERLPDVARTAGRWIGKMQRFVRGVKSDIAAELETGELKKLIGDQREQIDELSKMVRSTARELESTTGDVVRGARRRLGEMEEATKRIDADAEALEDEVTRIEADDDEADTASAPRPLAGPARPEITDPGTPGADAARPDAAHRDVTAGTGASGSPGPTVPGPGSAVPAAPARGAASASSRADGGTASVSEATAPTEPSDGTPVDEPAAERARGGGG